MSIEHIEQVKEENVKKKSGRALSTKHQHNHTQAMSRIPYKKGRWAIFQHFSFGLVGVHISDENKN